MKIIYPILLLFLFSCGERNDQHASVTDARPSDTAQATAVVQYAQGFTIDYHDGYKLVHVFDKEGDRTDTLEYLLVQKDHATPAGYPHAQVIPIPVSTIIALSSTHVGVADFAGVADRITGLGSLQYI